MANMSHCRFHNTLEDLKDCHANLNDRDLSYDEVRSRYRLIKLCAEIAEEYLCETEDKLPTREQFENGAVW